MGINPTLLRQTIFAVIYQTQGAGSRVRGCQPIHSESSIRKKICSNKLLLQYSIFQEKLSWSQTGGTVLYDKCHSYGFCLLAGGLDFHFTSLSRFVKSGNCLPLAPTGLKQQSLRSLATSLHQHLQTAQHGYVGETGTSHNTQRSPQQVQNSVVINCSELSVGRCIMQYFKEDSTWGRYSM